MRKLIAIALFVPSMASAEFFTGNKLLSLLNGTTLDQVQALGYIQGVFDAHSSVIICPPGNITAGQVNDMVKNYLSNTPALRHYSADTIIGEALSKVWPCQDKGKRL
jgi:hypothetical protein